MRLVHTCTKYGFMQVHTKDMHDQEELSPNDLNYGKPSQLDLPNQIRKVML